MDPSQEPPAPPWRAGLAPLFRAALYGAVLLELLHALVFQWAADDPLAIFGENRRLEIAQVVLIVLALLLALALARVRPSVRPLALLWAGLFAAVLVREHNNDLKAIGVPLLWELLVLGVVVLALACAWPTRRRLPAALAAFLAAPPFAWCAAGILTIVFVQALDEQAIWAPILGHEAPFLLRRVGEEVGELLGYGFLLAGMLEWVLAGAGRAAGHRP